MPGIEPRAPYIQNMRKHTTCLYCLSYSHSHDGVYNMDKPQACETCRPIQPRRLRRRLTRFIGRTGRVDGDDGGETSTAPRPENTTQAPPGPGNMSLGARPKQRAAAAASPTAVRQSGRSSADQSPARSWRAQRSDRNTTSPARSWGGRVDKKGGSPPPHDRLKTLTGLTRTHFL